jgi:hypothetical protein
LPHAAIPIWLIRPGQPFWVSGVIGDVNRS